MIDKQEKLQAAKMCMNNLLMDFPRDYDDCGEINHTKLTEDCAQIMEEEIGPEWSFYDSEFNIDEELFELAINVIKEVN